MKKKLLGRIVSIVISAVLIVGMMPLTFVTAAEGKDDNIVNSLSAFNNPGGSADDYSTSANPYGYADGQIFTMSTQDELFVLKGWDLNSDDNRSFSSAIYSDFRTGGISGDMAKSKMSLLPYASFSTAMENVPFTSVDYTDLSKDNALYHMQAVAFDPFNTGHNDHIAIVGVNSGAMPMLYIVDANSGKVVASHIITNGWNMDLIGNETQAFQASNFIAITAGRYTEYNKDKGETLIVYFPDRSHGPELYEFSVTKSGSTVSVNHLITTSNYLHEDYRVGYYGEMMQAEAESNNFLAASITTGDFNGDRIDDLAVLSSVTDPDGEYKNVSYQYFMPELYVVYGGGTNTVLDNAGKRQDIAIWNEDKTEMRTFTSPSVTAGDADGDGVDDIITAGWQLKVVKESSSSALVKEYKIQSGVTVGIYKGLNKNPSKLVLQNFDEVDGDNETGKITNNWTEMQKQDGDGDFNDTGKNYTFPQYCVEAVAINGDGAADYIFMNGTFCKFDKSNGLAYVFTPEYFQHDDSDVEGKDTNAYFIASTAVGVFDDNTVGREQIIVSVGIKEKGYDDYFFMLGTMGGYNYDDEVVGGKVTKYGTTEKIYSTAFDRNAHNTDKYDYSGEGSYQVFNKGNDIGQYLNCLIAAVDKGNDGVLAKYSSKKLVYSDPTLVAVLQAAPYFDELEGTSGETTYTVGTQYTIGNMSSNSTSFSIGVSAELEGPGVKVSAGSGYTTSWSESFEESVDTSYSTTFTAGENNQVVLQRTPIVVYRYQVQYGDTGWDNEIQVSIPAQPIYVQLTFDEYNAYVTEFNEALKESEEKKGIPESQRQGDRLKPINEHRLNSSSLLDNEGDPGKYIVGWSVVSGKNLSNATYGMTANDTGSITSEYSQSDSTTKTTEKTDGFYVNASIGTGASFLLGSAYVGVDTSVEGEWTLGSFTSTTTFATASGTVSNLGNVKDVPENIRSQYSFSWTFGRWEIWLDNATSDGIPVYGFQVSNLMTPMRPPTNVKAEDGDIETQVKLSWDAVSGATEYNIYNYDVTGARKLIATTTDTEYTYTIDTRTPYYNFAVSSLSGSTEGAISQKVLYYPQSSAAQNGITPQLRINSDTNIWEVSYDGGTTWASLDVKATGDAGTDGKDGVDGIDGIDGVNGVDGITPQFRINPETNIWEVSYDEGVTWASLGVKATGDKGEQGEKGDKGDTGADGQNGINGINGITPQLRINSTTNEWEASYDNGASWSSLGVKATGEKGEKGDKGDTGATGAAGADGKDGANGKDGQDGINGLNGKDGKDGKNGVDGKDGNGIVDIKFNENGDLIFTMTDGSTINAGKAPQDENASVQAMAGVSNTNDGDMTTVRTIATIAIVLSALSLLWNVVALVISLTKKKRIGIK